MNAAESFVVRPADEDDRAWIERHLERSG